MSSMILSRRDLSFQLYQWLKVESLAQFPRFAEHSKETFEAVIDLAERVATNHFATHNKKSDQQEPHFDGERVHIIPEVKAALQAYKETGLTAASKDYDLGGMQLPCVVEKAALSYFFGANPSTCAYPFVAAGNASTILTHGNEAQINAFAKAELEGRFLGTMCLSEPQAGSSLSDITTRAEYETESAYGPQYRLKGNKMWISGGEHELAENIVHLVLAKVPDENGKLIPGVKGISLFLVPKFLLNADGSIGEHNDVSLAGLNHKMGYRGTVNCLMNFGEGTRYKPEGKPGAIGYLVGRLHEGLHCMFHLMNEARIGVGLGAVMLGYTGYLHSLDYARNRPQGRPLTPNGKNPETPQVKIVEHADIKRMLLAQKSFVEAGLGLALYCSNLVDLERNSPDETERNKSSLLLEILTPIIKSWPSQFCLEANYLAIQIHGGYGYTRDYNVEQFYRDNRLNPIHEGTNGIQAQDLLGRKAVMQKGAALKLLVEKIKNCTSEAEKTAGLAAHAKQLDQVVQRLVQCTQTLWSANDPQITLANAAVYLDAFGHTVIAWIWLEQLVAVEQQADNQDDFYQGKRAAARYFFEWELPKTEAQFNLLESLNTATLEMQDSWF